MNCFNADKSILIVDRQEYWRKLCADALAGKCYSVHTLSEYNYSPGSAYFDGLPPDLVIFGCARIGNEERGFIGKVLDDKRRLVVLSAVLTWMDMRSLFLAGALDVTDKPYDPAHIVSIVEEIFETVVSRSVYSTGRL
jgi:DNA-binding NtrC family response regulator